MASMMKLIGPNSATFEVDDSTGILTSVNKTDNVLFIPISKVQTIGGTWTPTRIAQNNIVLRKTAAADTTYLNATLRDAFRTSTGKGIKVKSVDVLYSIGTAALTTHTAVIDSVTYANNTAVAVASHGGTLSGTLAIATQANPYLSTITLGTQSFAVTDNQDIRMEVAVVAAATSAYDFYGFIVNFDNNQN